jgi:hypothetical protein
MGRQLRERKPQAVKEVAAQKVQVFEDSDEVDDDEDSDEGADDEDSDEGADDESEDDSEETEEEEKRVVPQPRGTGRGRGRKRRQGRAGRKKPLKKRRVGTMAEERADQTPAPEATQEVALLKAQLAQLQRQVGLEQSQPTGPSRRLPDLQPLSTHNTTAAAILRFTAQNMRAAAVEQLAATIVNMPGSTEVDSLLARLPTTGRAQSPDEVD